MQSRTFVIWNPVSSLLAVAEGKLWWWPSQDAGDASSKAGVWKSVKVCFHCSVQPQVSLVNVACLLTCCLNYSALSVVKFSMYRVMLGNLRASKCKILSSAKVIKFYAAFDRVTSHLVFANVCLYLARRIGFCNSLNYNTASKRDQLSVSAIKIATETCIAFTFYRHTYCVT